MKWFYGIVSTQFNITVSFLFPILFYLFIYLFNISTNQIRKIYDSIAYYNNSF